MKRVITIIEKTVFGAGFLFLGGLFLVFTYNSVEQGLRGDKWLSASSTINYTYSVQSYHSVSSGGGLHYVLEPKYSFTARDGKTYYGQVYSQFGGKIRSGSEENLQSHLREERSVYYDPADPNFSMVVRPFFDPGSSLVFLAISIFLLIAGVDIAISEERMFEKPKKYGIRCQVPLNP